MVDFFFVLYHDEVDSFIFHFILFPVVSQIGEDEVEESEKQNCFVEIPDQGEISLI